MVKTCLDLHMISLAHTHHTHIVSCAFVTVPMARNQYSFGLILYRRQMSYDERSKWWVCFRKYMYLNFVVKNCPEIHRNRARVVKNVRAIGFIMKLKLETGTISSLRCFGCRSWRSCDKSSPTRSYNERYIF